MAIFTALKCVNISICLLGFLYHFFSIFDEYFQYNVEAHVKLALQFTPQLPVISICFKLVDIMKNKNKSTNMKQFILAPNMSVGKMHGITHSLTDIFHRCVPYAEFYEENSSLGLLPANITTTLSSRRKCFTFTMMSNSSRKLSNFVARI